jgi:hypothetical protein
MWTVGPTDDRLCFVHFKLLLLSCSVFRKKGHANRYIVSCGREEEVNVSLDWLAPILSDGLVPHYNVCEFFHHSDLLCLFNCKLLFFAIRTKPSRSEQIHHSASNSGHRRNVNLRSRKKLPMERQG